MNTRIRALCTQYQYSSDIASYLQKCCDTFHILNPSSVYLIGSVSRGELSWLKTKKREDIISDLEFLIFLKGKLHKGKRQELIGALDRLVELIPHTNPHFHIDFTLIPLHNASRINRNLAVFEMRSLGKILAGNKDDLLRLPAVSLQSLDRFALNQLVLVRLWWLLAGIPVQVVNGNASGYADFLFRYVACRNLLDVPTILLPHEGYLIATYKARSCFLNSHYRSLPAAAYFGLHFAEDVAQALRNKLDLNFSDLPIPAYAKTFDYYVRLIRYLLGVSPKTPIEEVYYKLFSGRTLFDAPVFSRQRLRMAILSDGRKFSLAAVSHFRRLSLPVESLLIAVLISMHMALNGLFEGRGLTAKEWLGKASGLLSRIDPQMQIISKENTGDHWINLRNLIGDMICALYGFFGRRHTFIKNMLNWIDDEGKGSD